jgi:acetylornithine/succinyldiaminopimelate/putrescine aminotransferase
VGNNPSVIRFEPPLVVSDAQIDTVAEAFERVCTHHHGVIGALAGLGRTILTRGRR